MLRKLMLAFVALLVGMGVYGQARAETGQKPFILAYKSNGNGAGSVVTTANAVAIKLKAAGFEIAGRYSPYPSATILVITNDVLKTAAAQNKFGAYGVAQRVAITDVNGEIQVSYTNPSYMGPAYRMKADLSEVTKTLEKTLGDQGQFGVKKPMSDSDLRGYHYMFGMEYFDDPSELATYDSYAAAVAGVEAGLENNNVGVSKVARIDVPRREETYFAVAMKGDPKTADKFRSDTYIMKQIDTAALRSTAHLPYEIVVSGKTVYALYARFRIAVNFPDLSMLGSNSFFTIMDSPEAIRKALVVAAGGKLKTKDSDANGN